MTIAYGALPPVDRILPADDLYVEVTQWTESTRELYVTVDGIVIDAWRSEFEDPR